MATIDFVTQKCEDGVWRLCMNVTDVASRYAIYLDVPDDVVSGVGIADNFYKGIIEGFAAAQKQNRAAAANKKSLRKGGTFAS